MNTRPFAWGRVVLGLVVAAVALDFLADTLPRLVLPLVVLALVAVLLRLVFFHTRRW
ncbi:MAG TPA: hypothetical protein VHW67_05740 [Solirubrobacteraceae bacterium]|nr:hypothetical protein [Solirubrobacteraceae bacterium]